MSKVFRLYSGGSNTYQGWNASLAFPYDSTARGTIQDPDGASAKNEITSIPSPFARIDLVKAAFREVCKNGNLDGNTIFHKMVSDSLDVGEIFFNIDRFKQQIEIITWDAQAAIKMLLNGGNPSHNYVADALQKYLIADAQTYNFDKMQNVYLLNYKNGPDQLNVIGATSPATLFFSGANDLSYVKDIYFANNDRPFDSDYAPLYKRDIDYVKAWWTLRATIPSFSTLFPEIDDYLNLTFRSISDVPQRDQLNAISKGINSNQFSSIDVQGIQQVNQVEVLGHNLLKKQVGVMGTSEFQIKPTRSGLTGKLPLVLPVDAGNKYAQVQYVNGAWGKTNKAEYEDLQGNVNARTLPFDGSTYPYLTISDFLEDTIIRVPHALNEKFYNNGGLSSGGSMKSFLLPIKPLLFKYFSPDFLQWKLADGKRAFELVRVAGGSIRATLRIPIVGNNAVSYIEYQRLYYKDLTADITHNAGGMKDFDFTGLVMPSVRFSNESDAYYIVSCVSAFSSKFKMEFYKGDQIIQNVPMDCRHVNKVAGFDYKAETYTLEQTNFDFIEVKGNGTTGMLLPDFPVHQGLTDFEFAVDLGTSNTHIEYKETGKPQSSALCYDENEALTATFFVPTFTQIGGQSIQSDLTQEMPMMAADFIPFSVGNGDFLFPTRTALSYAKITNWTQNLRPFGLLNFNMTYGKRKNYPYNASPLVNIKWSNDSHAKTAMQAYISQIMLLIRNKAVANNGNLRNVKVTWFYPNSMSPRRIAQLRQAWNDTYVRWLNPGGVSCDMSESEAPILYYFSRYATTTNLVNIDIGGGTTDVAFSSNGNVDYITSFKFAANSLFEDSFTSLNPNNGIVDWFKDDICQLLKSNTNLNDLVCILNENEGQPSNMASFLFSLKDNAVTKTLDQNSIDFNKILQDDTKFKLVFVIFYTAIIYHVAQIIKKKGLKMPRHIAFSGNGSKVVNILASDKKILENYTRVIFEQVMGCAYPTSLGILGLERGSNPKEATSKGGLLPSKQTNAPVKLVLKDSCGHMVEEQDTYASITDSQKQDIVRSVKDFFHFVLDVMPSHFKFYDNFGVDNNAFAIAKQECEKDLDTYLDKGIDLSVAESGNLRNPIEDALSFYPIKGVLQALSEQLRVYYSTID